MKIVSIEQIDRAASDAQEMCRIDASYAGQIAQIARQIYRDRHEKSVILLSGPSGSGKTTTAHMLEAVLDAMGAETHTISMDNYFTPFTEEQKQLAAQGLVDFESPDRMDIPFMNEQLEAIAKCRTVRLPVYDFENSARLFQPTDFCRKDGEIVLLEGIHALNPSVILLPDQQLSNVYISVRTRVQTDEGLLHPSYIRLLRRIIRDQRTRARSFAETISMYENVERGETSYIAPYKYRAQFEIDSFHAYELGVYKAALSTSLDAFSDDPRLERVRRTLSLVQPARPSIVPVDSLIREFIGQQSV